MFNYEQENGYWRYGEVLDVDVWVVKEKCNHEVAKRKFLAEFPNYEIVSITYA